MARAAFDDAHENVTGLRSCGERLARDRDNLEAFQTS
jgi:hypothetical protein